MYLQFRTLSASRPLSALRLMLSATGMALMLTQSVGSAMAQDVPTSGGPDTLPLQAATVMPSPPVADGTGGEGAQPDEMATMVATLQKQIIDQQALLQVLQRRLTEQPRGETQAPVAQGEVSHPKAKDTSLSSSPPVTAHTPAVSAPATGIPDVVNTTQPPGATPAAVPMSTAGVGGPSTLSSAETPDVPAKTGSETVSPTEQANTSPQVADIALPLTTDAQRQAYASGVTVWREIENSIASQRALGIDLDARYVLAGLQDMQSGHALKMSPEEVDGMMSTLNGDYIKRAREARDHQEAEGKAYRIGFSRKKGAYSDAGAWYLVADKGDGRHLRTTDMAELLVTGSLPDGTVFDASGQNGQSKSVKVGALLPSVAIGLQKVGVGGHITVVVPPGKGYGDAGLPPSIPGGATLIFDIQVKGLSN